jgi:formimidoylglutamate deiminase
MCPSTEADLGDGLGPAADFFRLHVPLCLGTDGQTSTSVLDEARRLEMHERLRLQQRNVLGRREGDCVAAHLLTMATRVGATALGIDTGALKPGRWADLVSFDLTDPALAGADADSVLSALLFSADGRAVRDVMVGGQLVVRDGHHPLTRSCCTEYEALCNELFGSVPGGKASDVD